MTHHNGKSTAPPVAVARSMQQLAHDVVELAELQTAMIQLELKGWWKQLVAPIAFFAIAFLLAVSSIPILILSGAYGLHVATDLGMGWSLLIAAGVSLLIGGIVGYLGLRALKAAHAPLEESRRELSQNVRWIKTVLQHQARPSRVVRSMHETN